MNSKIDYFKLIKKYYDVASQSYMALVIHSSMVTRKALKVGRKLGLSSEQLQFIEEAAMLHDIGIFKTDALDIGCTGELPYICHGVEGANILTAENLPKHARVAISHTGVGITKADVTTQKLPIPVADYLPETIEEKVISYADLLYSKGHPEKLWIESTPEKVRTNLTKFGEQKVQIFNLWHAEFASS